ncbi:MAG: RdgB/HAM1 family non-canonical purine NTP pyrophosphatase [Pseudomonadota bacterium]|nr:RdgB/HAM1 family non-canonical purine NTP pyrophosphatase [Pseudomonadota bacterium]
MDVIFASGNAGKVSEMQQLLAPFGLQLKSLKDFGLSSAEETATTFVENALIKARAAAHSAQLPAIADDSGLVVRALNGEPGVYSARYAGEDGNDAANNTKLLAKLTNQEDRRAYFFCCLVFLQHPNDPTPKIAFGRWHGEILQQPQGDGGFGYDPLFYVADQRVTAAQMNSTLKNQLSHRGQACQALLAQLQNQI